jgi:hypothetical protein
MPNGAAALTVLGLPAVQAAEPAVQNVASLTQAEIETAIGEAVADTAAVISESAFIDGGILTPERRERSGDLFVRLFQLQQSHPAVDFALAGKKALRRRLGTKLASCGRDDAELDAALSEVVSWPLGILRKITALERAWAN